MPILKAGQPLPEINQAPELYGVKVQTNSLMFQERCLKLFKPTDWVELKNIDDEPLIWQYMPEEKETIVFNQSGDMKETRRGDPEQWYIMPGESEPVPGIAALRGLDALYKIRAAKKTLKEYKDPNDPTKLKNGTWAQQSFNFSDANIQEDTLKHAFLGVMNPTFGKPSAEDFRTQAEPTTDEQPTQPQTRKWPEPAPVVKGKVNAGSTR